MNDVIPKLGFDLLAASWLPQALAIVVGVLILNVGFYYLLRHIEKAARRTTTVWSSALIRAARKPVTLILWVLGAEFVIRTVYEHAGMPAPDWVRLARDAFVIAALALLLWRLFGNAADSILSRDMRTGRSVDRTTVEAMSKLGRLVVVVLAGLIILQNLGFSISGVLAFGGIGGIAVGFAAKDMLANFFGGLTIYLDRPFVVGEWIRSPDKAIEGTVEYIGWRHTRVRAFNKNPIYVPNALFTTIVVENPTRMTNRRIKETIGLRYADLDKMAPIVADVKAMLRAHPEIDTGATMIVNFNQFGESSLDFFIYTFTRTVEWVKFHEVKQDVLLKVAGIIRAHGAEVALPTHQVHLGATDDGMPDMPAMRS